MHHISKQGMGKFTTFSKESVSQINMKLDIMLIYNLCHTN